MTILADNARITVPPTSVAPLKLRSFLKWAGSDELPEKCCVYFHRGEWGVDVSKEQVFAHGGVKSEFAAVLRTFANSRDLGHYFANGVLLVNFDALLACNPDGLFVSHDAFESKQVEAIQGSEPGYTELHGTPEMVLEVVSTSSVKKDTELLMKGYWEAGIPEYWLVDARKKDDNFRILKYGPKGYTDVRNVAGWLRSAVFDARFRFSRTLDRNGFPKFHLEIKA